MSYNIWKPKRPLACGIRRIGKIYEDFRFIRFSFTCHFRNENNQLQAVFGVLAYHFVKIITCVHFTVILAMYAAFSTHLTYYYVFIVFSVLLIRHF